MGKRSCEVHYKRPELMDEYPETQEEALLKDYPHFKGGLCKNGHYPPLKHTSTGDCVECGKERINRMDYDMKGKKAHEVVNEERVLNKDIGEVWDEF